MEMTKLMTIIHTPASLYENDTNRGGVCKTSFSKAELVIVSKVKSGIVGVAYLQ